MVTVQEFRVLFQKNLNELIWRDRGWGPIPIHGKGEKGWLAQDRLKYNTDAVASLEIDDDKLNNANQILSARSDVINKLFQDGKITKQRKDQLLNSLDKQFTKNVEKRKQIKTTIAQKEKIVAELQATALKTKAFGDKDLAHEFGMKHYEAMASKLTDTEVVAMKSYKGTDYKDINNRLRGKDINGLTDKKIKELDSAMEKAKLNRNIIVHRGMSIYEPDESAGTQEKVQYVQLQALWNNPQNAKGIIISDSAFVSTSLHKPFANSWGSRILLNINAPKGTKALYLDAVYQREEYEMLLPRGSKFKIKSATKVGSKLEINADLIK